jgi:hypothetical protein
MKEIGVIVSGFQTTRRHEGHRNLIDKVMARHNKIYPMLNALVKKYLKK